MEIYHETAPADDLRTGNVTVGLVPIPLAPQTPQRALKGVLLSFATSNTAPIWLGRPNVTPQDGFGGMPPGSSIAVPVDFPHRLFLISTDADQKASWMAL